MQLFSADATIFKFIFFAHENMKKKRPQKLLVIGPIFFFSTANVPRTSPNLKFCSMKLAHCTTYV